MKLLNGHEAVARVKGILSAKHQVHAYSVDLTVKGIWGVDPIGRLDFGGGEYAPAGHVPVEAHRLRAEDNYEWWELERGCYFIEYNESLELGENEIALLEPDPRTLRTGAAHASVFIRGHAERLETLFDVNAKRLAVKQNARISRLRVFRLDDGLATTTKPASARKTKATPTVLKRRRK
jgi:deoxycytidine triphosphate deaminase